MPKLGDIDRGVLEWDERKHPRDLLGRFRKLGSGGRIKAAKDAWREAREWQRGKKAKPVFVRPAETTDQAEEYARDVLGIRVDYGSDGSPGNVNIANYVNEGLTDLSADGFPIPGRVKIGDIFTEQELAQEGLPDSYNTMAIAAYRSDTATVYFSPRNGHWEDEAERAAGHIDRMHAQGWMSSPDPKHPVYHEVGHYLHHWNDPVGYMDMGNSPLSRPLRKKLAREVSKYGASSKREFVAEVFAGSYAGKKYSEGVMDLYYDLGGYPLR